MKIVSKTGLNLVGPEILRYDLVLLPTRVLVDGVEHGDDEPRPFATIDRWVREAKVAPAVLGTSEEELLAVLTKTAERDAEILVVTASRKLATSHDEAVRAVETLWTTPGFERTRVLVVDTGSSDVGGGLPVIFAGEASRAGLSLDEVAEVTRAFAEHSTGAIVPKTLEHLVRGGHASFLRAMMGNLLGMSPVIDIIDGEMRPVGRTKRGEMAGAIFEHLKKRVAPGRKVWAGVAHGGDAESAQALAAEVRRAYQVELMLVRPLSVGSYVHLGEDALACYVAPIDQLAWAPSAGAVGVTDLE